MRSRDADDTRADRAALAVGLPTAAYGISFGALATVGAGLDVWQTMVLSLVMFTGGSQFALVGVLASGGLSAWPSAVASAALLGSRNAVYAMSGYDDQDWSTSAAFGSAGTQSVPLEDYDYRDYR